MIRVMQLFIKIKTFYSMYALSSISSVTTHLIILYACVCPSHDLRVGRPAVSFYFIPFPPTSLSSLSVLTKHLL